MPVYQQPVEDRHDEAVITETAPVARPPSPTHRRSARVAGKVSVQQVNDRLEHNDDAGDVDDEEEMLLATLARSRIDLHSAPATLSHASSSKTQTPASATSTVSQKRKLTYEFDSDVASSSKTPHIVSVGAGHIVPRRRKTSHVSDFDLPSSVEIPALGPTGSTVSQGPTASHESNFEDTPTLDAESSDNWMIIDDIRKAFPALALTDPAIARLMEVARHMERNAAPMFLPTIVPDPSTWSSSGDSVLVALWTATVYYESLLPKEGAPDWLSLDEAHLVKSYGRLDAPLLIVSTYPPLTEGSSVHLRYGMVNYVSNRLMMLSYTKLGFSTAEDRTSGMLHIDAVPRRMHRRKVPGGGNADRLFSLLEKARFLHWRQFNQDVIRRSNVRVCIIFGDAAVKLYLQLNDIT
ncbi:hypothetical protein NX059_005874 [Plenodomus lindquistii]|nr:hypothetical protein NX059_005874 [Plenodomus lindquistii]